MACFATPYGLHYAAHCFNRAYAQNNRPALIPAGGKLGATSAPTTHQWNDVSLDPSDIRIDRGLLFRSSTLAEDETVFEVLDVALAELLHRHRLMIFQSLLCRIITGGDTTQLSLGLAPGKLGSPDPMQPNRHSPRSSALAVLDDVATFA